MSLSAIPAPIHRLVVGVACMDMHDETSTLAVVRNNCSVELWHVGEGNVMDLVSVTGGYRNVTPRSCHFIDAATLVVATVTGQYLLFNTEHLVLVDVVMSTGGGILSSARRTNFLAAAHEDGSVRLYDTTDRGLPLAGRCSKHPKAMMALSVCFSPDECFVFSGDNAGVVQKFDVAKVVAGNASAINQSELRVTLREKRGAGFIIPLVWTLTCVPATSHLVAGTSTGDVFIINTSNGSQLNHFFVAKAPLITSVASGATVLVGGVSRDIVSFELGNAGWSVGSRTRRIHSNDVTALVSGLKTKLITGSLDGDLFISSADEDMRGMFTAAATSVQHRLYKYTGFVHPSQSYATATWCEKPITFVRCRNSIQVWSLDGGKLHTIAEFSTSEMSEYVRCIAAPPDGSYLAYGTDCGVHIVSLEGSTPYNVNATSHDVVNRDTAFVDATSEVTAMCFAHADAVGWILFYANARGSVSAVSMSSGRTDHVYTSPATVTRIVARTNPSHVAMLDTDGAVCVWDVQEWKPVAERNNMAKAAGRQTVVDVCFCDNEELALLSRDGNVTVMSYSGKKRWTTRGTIPNYPPENFAACALVRLNSFDAFAVQSELGIAVLDRKASYTGTREVKYSGRLPVLNKKDDTTGMQYVEVVRMRSGGVALLVDQGESKGLTIIMRQACERMVGNTVYNAKRFGT